MWSGLLLLLTVEPQLRLVYYLVDYHHVFLAIMLAPVRAKHSKYLVEFG